MPGRVVLIPQLPRTALYKHDERVQSALCKRRRRCRRREGITAIRSFSGRTSATWCVTGSCEAWSLRATGMAGVAFAAATTGVKAIAVHNERVCVVARTADCDTVHQVELRQQAGRDGADAPPLDVWSDGAEADEDRHDHGSLSVDTRDGARVCQRVCEVGGAFPCLRVDVNGVESPRVRCERPQVAARLRPVVVHGRRMRPMRLYRECDTEGRGGVSFSSSLPHPHRTCKRQQCRDGRVGAAQRRVASGEEEQARRSREHRRDAKVHVAVAAPRRVTQELWGQ